MEWTLLPVFPVSVPLGQKHRRVLGESIRVARRQAGLTQEKLAERADLNTAYLSDVERGEENISVDALVRIAKALKVRLCHLLKDL